MATPTTSVYIGNASFDTDEESLHRAFGAFGRIERVRVMKDKFSGRPKGFAFVKFSSHAEACDAIERMDGVTLDGRQIRVDFAADESDANGQPPPRRPRSRSPPPGIRRVIMNNQPDRRAAPYRESSPPRRMGYEDRRMDDRRGPPPPPPQSRYEQSRGDRGRYAPQQQQQQQQQQSYSREAGYREMAPRARPYDDRAPPPPRYGDRRAPPRDYYNGPPPPPRREPPPYRQEYARDSRPPMRDSYDNREPHRGRPPYRDDRDAYRREPPRRYDQRGPPPRDSMNYGRGSSNRAPPPRRPHNNARGSSARHNNRRRDQQREREPTGPRRVYDKASGKVITVDENGNTIEPTALPQKTKKENDDRKRSASNSNNDEEYESSESSNANSPRDQPNDTSADKQPQEEILTEFAPRRSRPSDRPRSPTPPAADSVLREGLLDGLEDFED